MNDSSAEFYSQFAERFIKWANQVDNIEAAYVIGSQARDDHPADEWSDMDILMFASNPDYYLKQSEWLNDLGDVLSSFSTFTVGGDPERLTLFRGGYQVDFVVAHTKELDRLVATNTVHGNFYRGVKVLLDKNSVSPHILPQGFHAPTVPPISEDNFSHVCHMFWFAVQYVAKQVLRDELWVAKARDSDLKKFLLQMIEWYEKALNGPEYDTWHAGRFMKEWASIDVYNDVLSCFGRFNKSDSWVALMQTASLFKRLSHRIARQFGYSIPQTEAFVQLWLHSHEQRIDQIL